MTVYCFVGDVDLETLHRNPIASLYKVDDFGTKLLEKEAVQA